MTIWTGVDPAVHQMNVAWLEVSVRLEQCSMYIQYVINKTCYNSYCIWALLNVVWVEVSVRLAQSSNM